MTERVLGPTGGRRRKRVALLVPVLALAALILAMGASAGAISNTAGFQGDDANLADEGAGIDWNSFASVSWTTGSSPYRSADKTALGWEFKGLEDAQNDGSDTVFGGGAKQDDNCANVNTGPKPPNKDDLKRAYVASAVVGGRTYVALAWARIPQNTTSSSAHVGFEFNQGSTACSGSSLVSRSTANGGDLLIVYDFEGGSGLPVLKLLRWKTTGTCEQTGKAATAAGCWVFVQDLTQAGNAEARVNTTNAADAIHPNAPPDDTLATQEFGEAIVDLTGAEIFPPTPTSCFTLGKVFAVSRSSGNSGTAAMKDLVGPGNISISNCATVKIRKQTVPDQDPNTTDFNFSTTVQTLPGPAAVADFTLKDDGVKTINDVKPGTGLAASEASPLPGYKLTNIDCQVAGQLSSATNIVPTITAGGAGGNVTFDIASEQTLDCTFTNTRQKVESSMDTAPWIYPNDKATVDAGTGQTDIDGTVQFKLFGATNGGTPKTAAENCDANGSNAAAGLLYSETVTLADAAATSKDAVTTNDEVKVEADAIVVWRVTYSGDSNHFGRLSDCVESIDVDLTGDTDGDNVPDA